ncbi:MAG TPA: lytic murein transglycosylase, partial [Baekduia sp.]|nr:lytic murein transglycosylase [Baekduia sp.]
MRRRKLLIGLMSAGAFTAGFSAAVFPASAQLRTITVTLLGGETVTVQVDTPPDAATTGTDALPAASTSTSDASATTDAAAPTTTTDTSSSPTPAPPAATPDPASAAPAPAATDPATTPVPSDATPAGTATDSVPTLGESAPSVSAGGQQGQETVGKELRKATGDDADKSQSDGKPDATAIRQSDGVPTSANPTFAQGLPGAAAIGVPNFFIDKFRIPPFLLPIYQAAGIEYGIRWEVLAGINEIETDYGRNLNVSTAGALGWMQFMPSTWKQYGVDANHDGKKDPFNPVDAIFAAARYLKAAGAEQDISRAIFAYNHADWYVQSVLLRARLIGGMPADLVGSLTGLTQGHFPVYAKARYADDLSEQDAQRRIAKGRNAAVPVESTAGRRGIRIFARSGAPVVAVQDGRIVRMGRSARLGRFVQLRDVYGNTYTYARLKRVSKAYPVPKQRRVSRRAVARELGLPAADPKPSAPATA